MSNRHHIEHTIAFSDLAGAKPGEGIEIIGDEAHHAARVKRVRVGDQIRLLDGQGRIGCGQVREIVGSRSKPRLIVDLTEINTYPPITPIVEIWSALPKADRLDRMIDQLTQIGVTRFRALICDRSQRKPETVRPEKLTRIALEACKQCHRPWSLDIGDPIGFDQAIQDPDALLADASGEPLAAGRVPERVVVLIGPEGGWSDAERAKFGATGRGGIRFGLFVFRIESAACAISSVMFANTLPIQKLDPSQSP